MDVEKVHLGFAIKDVRDGRFFSYRGASAGSSFWFGVITFSLVMAVCAGIIGAVSGNFLAPFLMVLLIGIGIGWMFDASRQTEGDFIVRDQVIEVGGRRYGKADISEILVRNNSTNVLQAPVHHNGSGFVVMGTGMAGAVAVAAHGVGATAGKIGAAAGAAIAEGLSERSYQVAIRHGSQVIPLAKNLKQDVAIALFNAVTKAV